MNQIPEKIDGVRIRRRDDGSIFITKNNKSVIEILDSMFPRLGKGLSWMPSLTGMKYVSYLSNIHSGKLCYIVGKGPDLDEITETDFMEGSPILAINESVHRINQLKIDNPLYLLQRDTNITVDPGRAIPIIPRHSPSIQREVDRYLHSFPAGLSAEDGLYIADMFGCREIRLLGFNAAMDKKTAYADCVGHKPSGDPKRFLKHGNKIKKLALKLKLSIEFVKARAYKHDKNACIPEMLPEHQIEHHELEDSQSQVSYKDTVVSPVETEEPQPEMPDNQS